MKLCYFTDDPEHPGTVILNVTIDGKHYQHKLTKGQRDNAAILLVRAMAKDTR